MKRQGLTPTELLILSSLNRQPKHGGQIIFEARTEGFEIWLPFSKAQIYRVIPKLFKSKMIEWYHNSKPQGSIRNQYLKISDGGKERLWTELTSPRWPEVKTSEEFLMWVCFMKISRKFEKRHPFLGLRKKFLKSKIQKHLGIQCYLRNENRSEEAINLKLKLLQAELAWLRAI